MMPPEREQHRIDHSKTLSHDVCQPYLPLYKRAVICWHKQPNLGDVADGFVANAATHVLEVLEL